MSDPFIVEWSQMRHYLDATIADLAHVYRDEGTSYYIMLEAYGGIHQACRVPKSDPPSADQLDFETNFKNRRRTIMRRTSDNVPRVAVEKTDLTKVTKITHDWCHPETWYSESIHVPRKQVALLPDMKTAPAGDVNIIDTFHGLLFQEQTLVDKDGRSYRTKLWKNGQELAEVDPHTGAGDFTVDYRAGTFVLRDAAAPGDVIEVSYHKADKSGLVIEPLPGTSLIITEVEINFSADFILTDSALFQPRGNSSALLGPLVEAGIAPANTEVDLGPPLVYKTMRDYYAEAQKSYPVMPPLGGNGWRGIQAPVYVLSWDYVSATKLRSSAGMKVRVSLEHDTPFEGTMATVSFYCQSEPE